MESQHGRKRGAPGAGHGWICTNLMNIYAVQRQPIQTSPAESRASSIQGQTWNRDGMVLADGEGESEGGLR